MSVVPREQLQAQADLIRNETQQDANTPERVGKFCRDTADSLSMATDVAAPIVVDRTGVGGIVPPITLADWGGLDPITAPLAVRANSSEAATCAFETGFGFFARVYVCNVGTEPITMGGDGITINGDAIVPAGTVREFVSFSGDLWAQNGAQAIDGVEVLEASLFWGSSLTATSPDRVMAYDSVSDPGGSTITTGQPDAAGGTTAIRVVPDAGTYNTFGIDTQISADNSLTAGTRTHMTLDFRAEDDFLGQDSRNIVATIFSYPGQGDNAQDFSYAREPALANLRTWPARSLLYGRQDGWVRINRRADWVGGAFGPRLRLPYQSNVTFDGAAGYAFAAMRAHQWPLATLPNLSSGSGTASIADEGNAPDLEKGDIYPDQQLVGWGDGSRCIDFAGQSEEIDLGGVASALSGTDTSWGIDLLWRPVVHPDTDATIWEATGTTASLKLIHLSTGYLRLARTADDGSTISVDFDRRVGLVQHALTVQVSSSVATVWSQGQQWGASKAFASGKEATFTASRLGGSEWVGKIAELSVRDSAHSAVEVKAVHDTLCLRRNVPVGARETWLMVGQSNCLNNGHGDSSELWSPIVNCGGSHYECELDDDSINNQAYSPGWGVARAQGQDKRASDSANPGAYNQGFHNFGGEAYFHSGAPGVTTIRVAKSGLPVTSWLPGNQVHTSAMAFFNEAIADAGVPLDVVGVYFINGESDASGNVGDYYNAMTSLFGELRTRYATGDRFCAIVRKLPYYHNNRTTDPDMVRGEVDQFVADDPANRVTFAMDDDYLGLVETEDWWDDYPERVHGGTPQRIEDGKRAAQARLALGF